MAPNSNKKTGQNFEASMERLEEIVRQLEDEEASLEDSLKLFSEGRELAKRCQKELRQAENQVRQLLADEKESDSAAEAKHESSDDKEDDLPF